MPDGGVYVPPADWTFEAGPHCLRPGDFIPCVNGEEVNRWTTSENHALYVARDSAGQKPHYHTGGANGRPYVEFDGINDLLHNDTWPDHTWQCTYFIVAHPDEQMSKGILLNYHSKLSFRAAASDSFPHSAGLYSGTFLDVMWTTPHTPQLTTYALNLTGGTWNAWLNNTDTHNGVMIDPVVTDHFVIGGDEIFNTGYLKGRVYEIRRYPAVLTAPQREQVQEELRVKYALW